MSTSSPIAKGWKTNLLLLLILLLATTSLWWLDQRDTSQEKAEKASKAVSIILPKEVVRIQFHDKGGKIVNLERQQNETGLGNHWRVVSLHEDESHHAPANIEEKSPATTITRMNAAAIEQLLEILTTTYDQKVADTTSNPAHFGLEPPVAILTVYDTAGQTVQLSVGNSAPASKKRYLQIGAKGPVVMLVANLVTEMLQKWEDLRDNNLFANMNNRTLKRIVRIRSDERMVLEKDQDNVWKILQPLQDRASTDRIATWSNNLILAKGTGFLAVTAEEAFKENKPEWTFEIENSEGHKEIIRIKREETNLLAWRTAETDALLLNSHLIDNLNKSVMELVALRPLKNTIMPEKLQASYQGKTLTAAKENGNWPTSIWEGIEEILVRDAWRGLKPKQRGEPWLTLTAFQGEQQWLFPLWKENETMVLAAPGRPIDLELTPYQTEAFLDTIKVLFKKAKE